MKNNLKRFLPFLYRTSFVTQPGHETELAFVSGGVEYFKFTNDLDVYIERYFAALDAINAIEQRVTREYLVTHVDLMTEYLDKGKLSLAAVLNHNLKERISHLFNVDLLYQLASVIYFDRNENCYNYNVEYNEKKIALWRKDKEALAFFLAQPCGSYMPSPTTHGLSIPTYTRAQQNEMLSHLKFHLLQLSDSPKTSALISTLQSQILRLEELLTLVE